MRPLRQFPDTELDWKRRPGSTVWELRAGDEIVATLSRDGSHWSIASRRARATGRTAEREWIFAKRGFFDVRQQVFVRVAGADQDLAVLPHNKNEALLQLPSRGVLRFRRNLPGCLQALSLRAFAARPHEWVGGQGEVLITVLAGTVRIAQRACALPDLDLLVLLAWYEIEQSWRDAAGGGG